MSGWQGGGEKKLGTYPSVRVHIKLCALPSCEEDLWDTNHGYQDLFTPYKMGSCSLKENNCTTQTGLNHMGSSFIVCTAIWDAFKHLTAMALSSFLIHQS